MMCASKKQEVHHTRTYLVPNCRYCTLVPSTVLEEGTNGHVTYAVVVRLGEDKISKINSNPTRIQID